MSEALDQSTVQLIARSLDHEISIHFDYQRLLAEERGFLTKFDEQKVIEITQKKEAVSDALKQAHTDRVTLLRRFSRNRMFKLSDLVEQFGSESDKKLLLPKIAELKRLTIKSRSKTAESSQVVNFALRLISGTLSLIWSATQNITRAYTPSGTIKESFHPTSGRAAGTIKQA